MIYTKIIILELDGAKLHSSASSKIGIQKQWKKIQLKQRIGKMEWMNVKYLEFFTNSDECRALASVLVSSYTHLLTWADNWSWR